MLQCFAVCVAVLRGIPDEIKGRMHVLQLDTLQHTATHCNTLQHTATYCNSLQHTATHRNIPEARKKSRVGCKLCGTL